MTIWEATTYFDEPSLRRLASLVGARWRFITGDPLPERPGCLYAFDSVIVAVDGAAIDLSSTLVVLDFEGVPEDYPLLGVRDAQPDAIEAASKAGRMSFNNQGADIRRVVVVRERITYARGGANMWDYSSDIGVIFEVQTGAIGVSKASHHIEALFVSFGETIGDLDLPDRTIEWDWDNELGEEYQTSREFLDVLDLLDGPR